MQGKARRWVNVALAAALVLGAGVARAAEPAVAKGDARPIVAVLYFDYAGQSAELEALRKGLAQMLITDLAAHDGLRVVERERLEAVLAELELGRTKKVDPATANRIGKLLNARYLVLGSYFDVMGRLRADARLVRVETGEIVTSIGAQGAPGDFLEVQAKLADALGAFFARYPAPPPAPQAPAKPRPRPKRPKALKTAAAVQFGQALDALDQGNKDEAKATLQAVVAAQPDFALASEALDKLMQ